MKIENNDELIIENNCKNILFKNNGTLTNKIYEDKNIYHDKNIKNIKM